MCASQGCWLDLTRTVKSRLLLSNGNGPGESLSNRHFFLHQNNRENITIIVDIINSFVCVGYLSLVERSCALIGQTKEKRRSYFISSLSLFVCVCVCVYTVKMIYSTMKKQRKGIYLYITNKKGRILSRREEEERNPGWRLVAYDSSRAVMSSFVLLVFHIWNSFPPLARNESLFRFFFSLLRLDYR